MFRGYLAFYLAGLCALAACDIADEDRCLEGYRYEPIGKTCRPLPDAGADGVASDAADLGVEAGVDAHSSGWGSPCVQQEECTGEADFCAYDPIAQEGVCTFQNCTPTSCPEETACCDCAAIGMPKICGPADVLGVVCLCAPTR